MPERQVSYVTKSSFPQVRNERAGMRFSHIRMRNAEAALNRVQAVFNGE
jgi:hypothetical protein